MAAPLLLAGAVHASDAWVLPGVAVIPVTTPGTVRGMMAEVVATAEPVPAALTAETRNR
jgi:hypothetical protein